MQWPSFGLNKNINQLKLRMVNRILSKLRHCVIETYLYLYYDIFSLSKLLRIKQVDIKSE